MFVAQSQWKGQKAVTPVINSLYFYVFSNSKNKNTYEKEWRKRELHFTLKAWTYFPT